MENKGSLILIPTPLGSDLGEKANISYNSFVINKLKIFIVEELKTARRFLKSADYPISFDEVEFFVYNEHSNINDIVEVFELLSSGKDVGLLSEAGAPCIADPGSEIVRLAHMNGFRVVPLVGPSSIMLALMSSGLNGQQFTFHGYLPVNKNERINKIKEMEQAAYNSGNTQIFMETPYRNNQLLGSLINTCREETLLCVASNITLNNENIKTRNIREWKNQKADFHKMPAIFLINKQ